MAQIDVSKGLPLLAAWFCQFIISNGRILFCCLVFLHQLSQKGSLTVDGQAATPASVCSAETSSQQVTSDVTATLEPKVEHEDEEEEADEEGSMTGARTGKKGHIKSEEKPEIKPNLVSRKMHQTLKFILPVQLV